MTSTDVKIKPCRCGRIPFLHQSVDACYVACECGWIGPARPEPDHAIEKWNEPPRPPSDPPSAELV